MEKKEVEVGGAMTMKTAGTAAVQGEAVKKEKDVTAVQTGTAEQTAVKEESAALANEKAAEDIQKTEPKKDAEAEVVLQYRGYEINMETVNERIKAHYYAKGYEKGSIENMQVYLKPEDFTAYYVINDGVVGKVHLF